MLDLREYVTVRDQLAQGRLAMYQRWRELLFLHYMIDAAEVQRLLPSGLTVDTFPDQSGQEKAWIGLVPFCMEGIRFRGVPAVPGLSAFPETNVRTYVHRDGKEPGVWFFSLEAANRIAVSYARRFFSLPYHWAAMAVRAQGSRREYESYRLLDPEAVVKVSCDMGDALPPPQPGTLDFFLVERYLLYASRGNRLFKGQVVHPPYPVRDLSNYRAETTLLERVGLPAGDWCHAIFSPGVDVHVHSLQPVNRLRFAQF